jgi:hypothetical protein
MSRLATRLATLEKRHRPPQKMLGSHEVHCIGGWGHIEGTHCEEHEDCVYQSIPVPGPIRRVVMGHSHEGMINLLE